MHRRLVRMTLALVALAAGIAVLLGLKTEEITVMAPPSGVDDADLSEPTLHVALAAAVTASPRPSQARTPVARPAAQKPSTKPSPKSSVKPSVKPSPKPTPRPTVAKPSTPPKSTPAALPGFAGAVVSAGPYGPVQVQIVTSGGRITSVRAIKLPEGADDVEINDIAVPKLIGQTLERQSAQLDVVSGATYTSLAYIKSLQSAIDASRR